MTIRIGDYSINEIGPPYCLFDERSALFNWFRNLDEARHCALTLVRLGANDCQLPVPEAEDEPVCQRVTVQRS